MNPRITVALPKGRLLEPSIALLQKAGISCKGLSADTRRLVFEDAKLGVRLMVVRATDVPTYVEYGAADLGIVGKDVLLEQEPEIYEPVDLKFGACRLVVAASKNGNGAAGWPAATIRVATKYPHVAEQFFSERGLPVEIIRLSGNVELAGVIGLADRVVDLVTTGRTLTENDLIVEEVIAHCTARLVVNRASLKTKVVELGRIVDRLQRAAEGGNPGKTR